MKNINIKNILAGLGVCFILAIAGFVGLQTAAQLFNSNEVVENNSDPVFIIEDNLDPFSGLVTECESDDYGFKESFAQGLIDRSFDMTEDEEGNFYIVEYDKKRVQKLDKNFKQKNFTFTGVPFLGGNVGNQPTKFTGPKSVSVDGSGNLYVIDDGLGFNDMKVFVFDPSGSFKYSKNILNNNFQGNTFDYNMTTDSSGNIFVVDASHDFVEMIKKDNSSSFVWGYTGDTAGKFNYPSDAEVWDNKLYVMDSANDRIQIFDLNNLSKNPAKIWPALGTDIGAPAKITMDKDGNLYLLSNTNTERFIKKYNKDGNLISTSNFPFANPVGDPVELVFSKDGSIYILDSDGVNNLIHKFSSACGKIIIVKDTVPNDSQDFEFTKDFGDGKNFELYDSGSNLRNSKTFHVFGEKKYKISEILNANYRLSSIICTDPTSNTTVDLSKGLAIIDISKGEEVKCVFQNSKKPPLPESPKSVLDVE